jgi:hypothetical protein
VCSGSVSLLISARQELAAFVHAADAEVIGTQLPVAAGRFGNPVRHTVCDLPHRSNQKAFDLLNVGCSQ